MIKPCKTLLVSVTGVPTKLQPNTAQSTDFSELNDGKSAPFSHVAWRFEVALLELCLTKCFQARNKAWNRPVQCANSAIYEFCRLLELCQWRELLVAAVHRAHPRWNGFAPLPVWFLLRIDSVRVDNLLPHPLTSLTLTHYILLYNPSCVVARNCICHWNQKKPGRLCRMHLNCRTGMHLLPSYLLLLCLTQNLRQVNSQKKPSLRA